MNNNINKLKNSEVQSFDNQDLTKKSLGDENSTKENMAYFNSQIDIVKPNEMKSRGSSREQNPTERGMAYFPQQSNTGNTGNMHGVKTFFNKASAALKRPIKAVEKWIGQTWIGQTQWAIKRQVSNLDNKVTKLANNYYVEVTALRAEFNTLKERVNNKLDNKSLSNNDKSIYNTLSTTLDDIDKKIADKEVHIDFIKLKMSSMKEKLDKNQNNMDKALGKPLNHQDKKDFSKFSFEIIDIKNYFNDNKSYISAENIQEIQKSLDSCEVLLGQLNIVKQNSSKTSQIGNAIQKSSTSQLYESTKKEPKKLMIAGWTKQNSNKTSQIGNAIQKSNSSQLYDDTKKEPNKLEGYTHPQPTAKSDNSEQSLRDVDKSNVKEDYRTTSSKNEKKYTVDDIQSIALQVNNFNSTTQLQNENTVQWLLREHENIKNYCEKNKDSSMDKYLTRLTTSIQAMETRWKLNIKQWTRLSELQKEITSVIRNGNKETRANVCSEYDKIMYDWNNHILLKDDRTITLMRALDKDVNTIKSIIS